MIEDQPGNSPHDSIRNVVEVFDNIEDANKYVDEWPITGSEVFVDEWVVRRHNDK